MGRLGGGGRVPVGINTDEAEFNTAEKTGGEKSHALTVNELAAHAHSMEHTHNVAAVSIASSGAHTHTIKYENNMAAGNKASFQKHGTIDAENAVVTSGAHTHTVPAHNTAGSSVGVTTNQGSGTAHNNLQPYITCYMWKRTA